MKTLTINEIFHSIQGESSLVGYRTVFVRTTGCHLRCQYCDTKYAYYEGAKKELPDIIQEIHGFKVKHVCITGGEPLLQPAVLDLMQELCDLDYVVSLETSGAKTIEFVDPRVKVILDIKTPDSGEGKSFEFKNLELLQPHSEVKFVICSENDFNFAENFVRQYDLAKRFQVLYSPSFTQVSEKWLAKKMLFEKSAARLQIQMHKYIWEPDTRGV